MQPAGGRPATRRQSSPGGVDQSLVPHVVLPGSRPRKPLARASAFTPASSSGARRQYVMASVSAPLGQEFRQEPDATLRHSLALGPALGVFRRAPRHRRQRHLKLGAILGSAPRLCDGEDPCKSVALRRPAISARRQWRGRARTRWASSVTPSSRNGRALPARTHSTTRVLFASSAPTASA
jgi:hypothetical protein